MAWWNKRLADAAVNAAGKLHNLCLASANDLRVFVSFFLKPFPLGL